MDSKWLAALDFDVTVDVTLPGGDRDIAAEGRAMSRGGRSKGRRALTAAEREAAEWREFDHRQKLTAVTERVDADTSLVRLGPATRSEPGAGRTVRVTVPGRERVTKRVLLPVGIEGGEVVYRETELALPTTREALTVEPPLEGRILIVPERGRKIVVLPQSWQPDDVLGLLRHATRILLADRTWEGPAPSAVSGATRMMAAYAEPGVSLINAVWIPSASEVSLANWITDNWLRWIGHAVERVAVVAFLRGRSLRQIGAAIGHAAGDTNHTKSIIRKGLWRIGCKLDALPLNAWPRLADIEFVLDADR